MLRCQSVVLGVVAIATLPMICLSARSVTWPTSEKSYPGAAKNRKGLRHSPGVLMDVMRAPTSLKPVGFSRNHADQIASFSGGHRHHWHYSPQKYLPSNNLIVTRVENKQRKPYSTFKEHMLQRNMASTLNFAPANAIPWHTSTHTNYVPRPSPVWQLVPYPAKPEPTTTTPSPEPQQSNIVYRYAPTGTEAPASFTTLGTPRKFRHHVRLFTNAHQYKREVETNSSVSTPTPLPTDLPRNTDIIVDTDAIDEEHKESPWFKQLLGQVLAATEMTNH